MSLLAIYRLFSPYFTFQRKNLKQWMMLSMLVLGNVSQACLLVLLNSFFSHFFGVLTLPVITYQILLRSVAEYLFVLLVYTMNAFGNSFLAEKLTYHLYSRMSKSFLAKWFQSKAYYGGNFLGKNQVSNVATKLSHDILEANRTLLSLTNNFLNTIFGFTVGIVGLWQLSIPLKFALGGSIFVLPGYMMFAAVVYSLFYNFSVNTLGQKLEKTISKQRKHIDEMEAKVHHIEKYAESIELLNGSQYERQDLLHNLRKGKIHHNLLIKLNAGLAFFFEMNTQLRFFVGTLLNIPQIITKTISVDHLFIVSDYFYRVVAFFTWRHDNFNEITTLNVLIEKLSSLQEQMAEWEAVNEQKKMQLTIGENFTLDNLVIQKPDGVILLNQEKFEFNKSAITLIQGESGVGKTTLFRALAGLWPYVSGNLSLPCSREKIHVIPQQIFFPLCASLYEVMSCASNPEASTQSTMDELLKAFKLEIANPSLKMNWSLNLSFGEQQRIALIRAILAKPELLLMDEPYSALDVASRENCEILLKKYLPHSTIICIDHHSLPSEKEASKAVYNHQVRVFDQHLHHEEIKKQSGRKVLSSSF